MKLTASDSFDIDAGAVELIATDGPPPHGRGAFKSIKASIKISGGKIGKVDTFALANNATEEAGTSF